ncbi:hypothetical protein FACS189476_07380 [Spirochaetia bacterium]|nr:hypothetical protein FACS189476_07380 [Spirochaetia bacterium]
MPFFLKTIFPILKSIQPINWVVMALSILNIISGIWNLYQKYRIDFFKTNKIKQKIAIENLKASTTQSKKQLKTEIKEMRKQFKNEIKKEKIDSRTQIKNLKGELRIAKKQKKGKKISRSRTG